jgi:hypothetical protein
MRQRSSSMRPDTRRVDAARYKENCVGFTRGFVNWEQAKALGLAGLDAMFLRL